MTRRSLAAQLRNHAVQKGDFSVTEMDDDAVLTKYTCCLACGAHHVTGEALDRVDDPDPEFEIEEPQDPTPQVENLGTL